MDVKIIENSHWKEVEPDANGDVLGSKDVYTLSELKSAVDKEWNNMTEDEQHWRVIHADPSFLSYTLSYVGNRIEDGQKVEVDEFNYRFRIIHESE